MIEEAIKDCEKWRLCFKPTIETPPEIIRLYNIFTRAKRELMKELVK